MEVIERAGRERGVEEEERKACWEAKLQRARDVFALSGAGGFCECAEKFWDPGCCADLPPDDDKSRPFANCVIGGWAVEDPECPYEDPEEVEHVFLSPGCECPRCQKPLPPKREREGKRKGAK